MSKALRVFFLSLLVVIFAVSCAFASFELDQTYEDGLFTPEEDCFEGYPYTTRIVMPEDATVTYSDEELEPITAISWDISPKVDWMKVYSVSNDWVLVIDAKLPKYSSSNTYDFTVAATAYAKTFDDYGDATTVSEVGTYDLTITVLPEPDVNDYDISIDKVVVAAYSDDRTVYLSSDVDPSAVDEGYSVELIVPSPNPGYLASYINFDALDDTVRIFLPRWLSYDIDGIKTTQIGDVNYITSINVFYNPDLDYEPDEGTESTVHITGAFNVRNEESPAYRQQTFEWDVKVGTAIKHIKLQKDEAEMKLAYGETASVDLEYEGLTPVKFVLTDSTDTEVSGDVLGLTVTSDDTNIVLTVAPTKSGKYSGTITFTDSEGGADSADLTVEITPVIKISEDKVEMSAKVGATSTTTINIKGADLASYDISPDVPASFDLTSEDTTTTITLKIKPSAPADDYTGTLTVYDNYGNSDSVDVTLKATSTGKFTISPMSTTATVEQGKSTTLNFTTSNVPSSAAVTWIGTATSGTGLAVTFDPTGTTAATTTTATITASDTATSGTVNIYASANGQNSDTATVTVTVTEPKPEPGPEPEEPKEITVDKLDSTTQKEVAKLKALKAGGSANAMISVAAFLSSIGSTPVDAASWILYIGSRSFPVSSSSVNSTASDWTASLTDATTNSVKVNITAPDTISSATDIRLGFATLGTNTSGTKYVIPLATIQKSNPSPSPQLRSSSSGCSAGFGALALLFAVPLFIRRKRS